MYSHESMLIDFLAGDLDAETARAWDEHLLDCERCWQAVREDRIGRAAARSLRESARPFLADRIRMAVELQTRPRSARRHVGRRAVGVGLASVAVAVAGIVALLPSQPAHPPPAIAAVLSAAQQLPTRQPSAADARARPVMVRQTTTTTAAGGQLRMRYYRVSGLAVMTAVSDRAFPVPADARPLGAEMSWMVTRGAVSMYCPSPHRLVVAAVAASTLVRVAGRLPGA